MSDTKEATPEGEPQKKDGTGIDQDSVFMFVKGVNATDIKIQPGEDGKPWAGTIEGVSFRDALLLELHIFYTSAKGNKKFKRDAKALFDFIKGNLYELTIKLGEDITQVEAKYRYNTEITEDEIQRRLNTPLIMLATANIYGRGDEWLRAWEGGKSEELQGPRGEERSKLHRQSRSYLKTISRIVGRETSEPNLFSLPREQEAQTNPVRDLINKKASILGLQLVKDWQSGTRTGEDKLRIDNLSKLGVQIGATNYELKIFLLYLGGYTYPIVDKDTDGGITLKQELLFNIEFKYSKEAVEKYGKEYIGTSLAQFIKDAPIKYVDVKPSPRIIAGLRGKGLKNVLVSDKFIQLALDLSEIAYKILTYSASNRPWQTIGEAKLIEHLNLGKQQKAQGLPWIRKQITKGFDELQEKGHIKAWSPPPPPGGVYKFSYTDKYVKHKAFYGDLEENLPPE